MSRYDIQYNNGLLLENSYGEGNFFERYYTQLKEIRCAGLDNRLIWQQFCKVNKLKPEKQWRVPKKILNNLNKLNDNEIYRLLGMAIGTFFKGTYSGQGI
ncbi:MAG: hypothetical protein ACFFAO_20640 [Candidatus Hermodarchaeota archaeon]